ncbi:hypothetical protein EDB85DRAFT_1907971 [Lactarius pseudohatsudake]|nr:hypothetical protein EDB85DRAFT_1907971 [Lactarius pseudohatsudake]
MPVPMSSPASSFRAGRALVIWELSVSRAPVHGIVITTSNYWSQCYISFHPRIHQLRIANSKELGSHRCEQSVTGRSNPSLHDKHIHNCDRWNF